MNRSGWWRRRPRNDSRSTAPGGRSRRGSSISPHAVVLPDGNGQLSDGVVIETRLKARLLGAPVLRVDGTVVVSPGRLVDLARADPIEGVAPGNGAAVNGSARRRPAPRSLEAPSGDLGRAAALIADTDGRIADWHDD